MERLEEDARGWLETHKTDYKSFNVIRKEKDLNFTVISVDDQSLSFVVTCPVSEEDSWSVWSEDEVLQPHLGVILEFCESQRQKTISEILDKINITLDKVFKENTFCEEEEEDEDIDLDDDYYGYNDDEDDEPAETKPRTPEMNASDDSDEGERFFGGKANPAAFQRLVKDLKNMKKEAHKFGIEGSPRGDNLFVWDVKLTGFPTDTILGKDICRWAEKHKREPVVYLEMQFPSDYPMAPPFVRVTRPRFKFLTGHVTIGGSICMEMLTRSGWTPTNDIESILVQIRSEIMSDPNTRLDSNPDKEYGYEEAKDAFNRMVTRYGWHQ